MKIQQKSQASEGLPSLSGYSCDKIPVWLIVMAVVLSGYFIYLEVGHVIEDDVDQGTLYYSYNDAFHKQFLESDAFPQWNPYIQSGVSHHGNLPFPLSLSNLTTLLTGDGVLGYFFSKSILLVIGSLFFLLLLEKLRLRPLSCALALLLYFFYQAVHNSHEAIALHVASVLVYASLEFVQKRKFYILGLAGIFLGVALNDYVSQGTFAVLLPQLLLIFFLRGVFDWKSHLCSVFLIWVPAILIGLPTILPQIIDVQESSKILTPLALVQGGMFASLANYIVVIFIIKLSYGLIIVLTLALGAPPVYWETLNEYSRAFIKTSYSVLLLVLVYFILKPFMASLPLLGGTITAIDPNRFMFVVHFSVLILFAVGFDRFIFYKASDSANIWRVFFPLSAYLILSFIIFYPSRNQISVTNFLMLVSCVTMVLIMYGKIVRFKPQALIFIFSVFALFWYRSENISTKPIPKVLNPFQTVDFQERSIFPDETPETGLMMEEFLRAQTRKDFSETAEMRNNPLDYDIFQRYPFLEIPTIHGFSNIRSLRTHRLYLWMVDDLRLRAPKKFKNLEGWGNFTNNHGSHYDTELLNLMGVRYLVADKSYDDARFQIAMEGKRSRIFENPEAFPRAFLAPAFKFFDSVDQLGEYLRNASSATLRQTVAFLKKDVASLEGLSLLKEEQSGNQSEDVEGAKILKYSANQVLIEVTSNNPSLLVLTQSYHYGWSVSVNNKPSIVYPAYYAFLSTTIPKGKSVVTFTFSDPSFIKGGNIALIVLTFIMAISIISWFRSSLRQIS